MIIMCNPITNRDIVPLKNVGERKFRACLVDFNRLGNVKVIFIVWLFYSLVL